MRTTYGLRLAPAQHGTLCGRWAVPGGGRWTRSEVVVRDRWRLSCMADPSSGLERSLETTQYSPVISGDRLPADRAARSGLRPIEPEDGPHTDLESLLKLGNIKL